MSAPHEMASAAITVPEPGAVAMLASGFVLLVCLGRASSRSKRR
jgi:hypothetical protein